MQNNDISNTISPGSYQAVSFDVGYTLLGPVEEAQVVVRRFLAGHALDPSSEALAHAYERAETTFFRMYQQPLNDIWASDAGIRDFFEGYYVQLLGDLGLPDPDRSHARTIIAHYLEPQNWRVYPGVWETLAELRRRGYRVGIASDWGTDLRHILRTHGFTAHLDWAVISGGIGHAKPSPAFYNLVVKRAAVPAHRIVHIGDNYRADVLGARTAGMDGMLIDWTGRVTAPLDVPVLHSLAQLLELLPSLNNG